MWTDWIETLSRFAQGLYKEYGVGIIVEIPEYSNRISFIVSRGDFHKKISLPRSEIAVCGTDIFGSTNMIEKELEEMAREVSDAYEATKDARKFEVWEDDVD